MRLYFVCEDRTLPGLFNIDLHSTSLVHMQHEVTEFLKSLRFIRSRENVANFYRQHKVAVVLFPDAIVVSFTCEKYWFRGKAFTKRSALARKTQHVLQGSLIVPGTLVWSTDELVANSKIHPDTILSGLDNESRKARNREYDETNVWLPAAEKTKEAPTQPEQLPKTRPRFVCRGIDPLGQEKEFAEIKRAVSNTTNIKDPQISRFIGRGTYGEVYLVCDPIRISEHIVVKIFHDKDTNSVQEEARMQTLFHRAGLAPRMIGIENQIIVMSPIDGVLANVVEQQLSENTLFFILGEILRILQKMCDVNLFHGDLTWGNIGYQIHLGNPSTIRLFLIDFGRASRGCDPQLELMGFFASNWGGGAAGWLGEKLLQIYEANYGKVKVQGRWKQQQYFFDLWKAEIKRRPVVF